MTCKLIVLQIMLYFFRFYHICEKQKKNPENV